MSRCASPQKHPELSMATFHADDYSAQPDEFVDSVVSVIVEEGYAKIDGVMPRDSCDGIRSTLDRCLEARIAEDHYWGNAENQVLDNYFTDSSELLGLIHQPLTDGVMRRMIDDDYVLISPSARNRRRMTDDPIERSTSGIGWHTDSRFIQGGQGFRPSLCYMSVLMIDRFDTENGATHVIPGSHKDYSRPDDREADLPFEHLTGDIGSMVVLDTALWHRVGYPSKESRWGVFNTYGPWFMKPYHRFNELFTDVQVDSMSLALRQLLHFDSIPPRDHNESMITLRRVRESVEGGSW
jgi:hypothetical protein